MLLILYPRVRGQVVVGVQHGFPCIVEGVITVLLLMARRLFFGEHQTILPNPKIVSITNRYLSQN